MPEPRSPALPRSPTVRSVVEGFPHPVTAAMLAAAILERHPEYGGGRAAGVALDREVGASAPVDVWLDLVESGEEADAWAQLDGQRLILGLARLDHRLSARLTHDGFLAALASEVAGHATKELAPFVPAASRTALWREQALTRVAELRALAAWLRPQTEQGTEMADALTADIEAHLEAARRAAENGSRGIRSWIRGADLERAASNVAAAEASILRLAPLSYVQSELPSILTAIQRTLGPVDQRRARVEGFARRGSDQPLREPDRQSVISALRGALSESRRQVARVRSFRNVLLATTAILSVVAIALGVLGITNEGAAPLCFSPPGEVVCPTDESPLPVSESAPPAVRNAVVDRVTRRTTSPWDVVLVELTGLVAAAVASAAALRNVRGTSSPYAIPVALAALKLPTGALTAVLGLLLINGNFVPGLTALDSSAQIIAWGVIFGYAQQLFTRLVDRRAFAVLEDVGDAAPGRTGEPTVVTPETLASAVAVVRTALATPTLISYDGFLSVQIVDAHGRPLPDDGEGTLRLAPGAEYAIAVAIGGAPAPESRSARVSIRQGERANPVPFAVELDSDHAVLRAREQEVKVDARGGEVRLVFPLVLPEDAPEASVWVRLTQQGRLVQLVEVELELVTAVR